MEKCEEYIAFSIRFMEALTFAERLIKWESK
jgi:hypothetical protein